MELPSQDVEMHSKSRIAEEQEEKIEPEALKRIASRENKLIYPERKPDQPNWLSKAEL